MSLAVEFDRVAKRFRLEQERPRSLQERFVQGLRRKHDQAEEIWVLRDVSFTLPHGHSLGVIGPNGAGKSTLLKLCARVIEPTSGAIQVDGRVSALLELGLGFHPELTGRENIFLYGSLVGISRATMRRRLDEIVAFSEIQRFIDMPVKLYSSGMYMRLAFSTAIHVDADILLIDEAFAVGDAHFQQKCVDRIRDLQRLGVTMMFVSHSAEQVRQLCNKALWIHEGGMVAYGNAGEIVGAYSEQVTLADIQTRLQGGESQHREGSQVVEVTAVQFLNENGQETHRFRTGDPVVLRIHYLAHQRVERPVFGIAIHRSDGTHVNGPNTKFDNYDIAFIEGRGVIDYCIDQANLLPGEYQVSISICDFDVKHFFDYQHRLYPFWVDAHPQVHEEYGVVYLPSRWIHRAKA